MRIAIAAKRAFPVSEIWALPTSDRLDTPLFSTSRIAQTNVPRCDTRPWTGIRRALDRRQR